MIDQDRRLRALLAAEGVSVDALIEATKAAQASREELQELTGRALARLNREGLTFEEIERRTGIKGSTAHRWAKPYLTE